MILNQTFINYELLVGFNGTSDSSREIVEKYKDPRIKVFDYQEKGKAKTLNKLLIESKFNFICIQDDDDIWINNKLEKQIPFLNIYNVVGSLIFYINENGQIIGRPNLSTNTNEIKYLSMEGSNQIANSSAIFRKHDAQEINGWREEFDGIEDFDFWLRLMRNGKSFINVPEELVLHRLHPNSKFNTQKYDLSRIL